MFCVRCFLRNNHIRSVSTKIKIVPELNTEVRDDIANNEMNPKKHPGVMKILPPEVPEKLLKAIKFVLRDKPVKTLIKDGEALSRYLEGRHPPMDEEEMKEHVNRIRRTSGKIYGVDIDNMSDEDLKHNKKKIQSKISELYKKYTYNWKPVHYNDNLSLVYLVARTAPEYAVVCKIFNEIFVRDKNFQPKSLFDFGSGVGVVTWAAKRFWADSLSEFYCVDASSDMNDLSQALLQGGKMKLEPPKGVYFRQFLPSQNILFDIVVTAHTLFELPSKQARLEIILNLWQKTRNYLVIVERGTNAGFRLINEVRDFILFSQESKIEAAHVFAPCPHEFSCPRLELGTGNIKDTPCNFEVCYYKLPLDEKTITQSERYSYVILKKGGRKNDDDQWPRIVRPIIKRSGHCVSRLCTADGKLKEVIFTAKKHGKIQYRCARSSRWGDILPIKLIEKEIIIEDVSNCNSESIDEAHNGISEKCDDNDDKKL